MQMKKRQTELAGKGTPPGFTRGETLQGTEGPNLGTSNAASAKSAFGVDLGSSEARSVAMSSRDTSSDSMPFKWTALPQRKPRTRRTRITKYNRVPHNYSKSSVGKKRRKTKRHNKGSVKAEAELVELINKLSVNPDEQARIDTAALTGFLAGLKIGSRRSK